jgi:hypothetical protein
MDRRMAIGGALIGAVGLALPDRQGSGRVVIQRGIVGGGRAEFGEGGANFSIFASRLNFEWETQEVIVGSVLWVDVSTGSVLHSTSVTDYIVPQDQPAQGVSRQIVGIMNVDGEGDYPFELDVIDAQVFASGQDSVSLKVGDAVRRSGDTTPAAGAGFSYIAAGPVAAGDIQELDIDINTETGVIQPADH